MIEAITGMFTRHLVTKFVSLLLAIVLFVFTQQGISDTQPIDELEVRFELTPEASKTWVLLERRVQLRDIKVRGLRDTLTLQFAGLRGTDFRKNLVIDEEFLRTYQVDGPILLDPDFCRDEHIPWEMGRDFELIIPKPYKQLNIAPRVNRTFRPALTPEMAAMLDLPSDFKFLGPGGAARPPITWDLGRAIAISGPEDALPPEPTDGGVLPLYVNISALQELLRDKDTLGEARGSLPIESIDWARSDVSMLRHIRVEAPNVSREYLFREIFFRVDVEERRDTLRIALPIKFGTDAKSFARPDLTGGKISFLVTEGMSSQLFQHDDGWSLVSDFELDVAQTWTTRADELKKFLAVTIDFSRAKTLGEQVVVPIRLERLGGPADIVDMVRITRAADASKAPGLVFQINKDS